MYRFKPILVLLSLILMQSCASVPFRTMWELRGMGPEALTEVKPSAISAAVMSESLLMDHPDMEQVRLYFSVSLSDESKHEYLYYLNDVTNAETHRLPPPDDMMSWRVYQLNHNDFQDFSRMQDDFGKWLSDDGIDLNELQIAVLFTTVGESEGLIDGINRMIDSLKDTHPEPQQIVETLEEWEREGIRVRIDLQLFQERGFMELMRTTRIPITKQEKQINKAM